MFAWQDRRDLDSSVIERCFTDSLGGVSEAPFASLNLGRHVGDNDDAVLANRQRVANALGVPTISWLDQVHGKDVAVIDESNLGQVHTADAQVTRLANVALAVMVADCTPVLLHDADAGVIGVAHAGRPGMVAGVVPATIEAMRELGATKIEAALGPSVCGRCYEVPEKMRADAARIAPLSQAITWKGTPAIDVASGVMGQLAEADIPVTWVKGCTLEDESLFSYRRDGQTGRFAGLIVRRDASSPERAS